MAGNYTVTAYVQGVNTPASFSLTNTQAQTGTTLAADSSNPKAPVYGQTLSFDGSVSNTSGTGGTPTGYVYFYADRSYNNDGSLAAAGTNLSGKDPGERIRCLQHHRPDSRNAHGHGGLQCPRHRQLRFQPLGSADNDRGPGADTHHADDDSADSQWEAGQLPGPGKQRLEDRGQPGWRGSIYLDRTYNTNGSVAQAGTLMANQAVNNSGLATFSTTGLPAGTHTVTAVFDASGTGSFASSHSAALTQKASASKLTYKTTSPGQFTLTVGTSANPAGTPIPTGSVRLVDIVNGVTTVLGVVTLTNGLAKLPVTLGSGNHTIIADYLGDSTYAGSTNAVQVTV